MKITLTDKTGKRKQSISCPKKGINFATIQDMLNILFITFKRKSNYPFSDLEIKIACEQ